MSIPITSLEKWSYKRGCQIFRDLYKATEKTTWIRIPALIATEKCVVIETAALVGVIAKCTFHGLKLVVNPYQAPEQRHYGWVLLKNIPSKGLNLIKTIISGLFVNPIWIAIDGEHYILEKTEKARVNWKHADKDTMNSEDHKYELEGAISEGKIGRKKWKNQFSVPSEIDPRMRVSKFTWAVTLVTHKGSNGNHTQIIVEGINDGFYNQKASLIGAAQKVGLGEKFIHLADYSPQIQSGLLAPDDLKYETRTEIWLVPSNKVRKMLMVIEKEKNLPKDQCGPLSCSGELSDNCFTWAREQLKWIDIDLGEGYLDYATAMAKNYTRNKEEYTNIPIQEWNN